MAAYALGLNAPQVVVIGVWQNFTLAVLAFLLVGIAINWPTPANGKMLMIVPRARQVNS